MKQQRVVWIGLTWMVLGAMGHSADLTVGPGKAFRRIEEALAKAQPDDTILVSPLADHQPYEKVAIHVTRPRITIRAASGPGGKPVPLSGRDYDHSGVGSTPRAIVQFSPDADGCVLDGFELTGAHNGSHNGAGVRINQANDVTIRNCIIHHNDMGVMSNGDGTSRAGVNQLIERCHIYSNGDPADPGYNHNLYLGGTNVTLLACEIDSSLTGHNVKSRAHRTTVLACYIHDSVNRELDLVDGKGDTNTAGSDAVLAGNVIVKAANCPGNRAVVHFGQDGGHGHDGTLYLVHNTIVTPFISPVVHLSAPQARASLFNNLVWNGGTSQGGQKLADVKAASGGGKAVQGVCNWLSQSFQGPELSALGLQEVILGEPRSAPPFVASRNGDYRLARKDATFVDRGRALPRDLLTVIGRTLSQYKHPSASEDRPADGKPDLGAYEFVAQTSPSGTPKE